MQVIALLFAVTSLTPKLDAYLAPIVRSKDLNGVVLVAKGDKVLFEKAYGLANVELNAPLTARSRFRIASVTKTFTAAAISILAERGKLSYDDPLSKYIPDFPSGDKIEIRHLLGHASGVGESDSPPCSSATLDDLVREIASKKLAFEPGTKSRYSNAGYALLARVVERASGMTWAEFLEAEIMKPLSLSETRADTESSILPRRVSGYVPGPGASGVLNARCQGAWAAYGSGALVSSASDLYRWARAVRNETLFKRSKLEFPFGWGPRKYFDRAAIEQSGIMNGTSSYVAAYLDDDLYVVVLSNVQSGMLTAIGKGIAAVALGAEAPKLRPSPPIVDADHTEIPKWVGSYTNAKIGSPQINESDGALTLRWCQKCDSVYLVPSAPMRMYDRQDSIALELLTDGTIKMTWPEGNSEIFARR
jgi:CubicO group peptidase (beta-lactamase class C family)